jgi:2,4-dienoyl-CoA reductase-like NADH-dependent reductase (Old Yellow Enzyme family)
MVKRTRKSGKTTRRRFIATAAAGAAGAALLGGAGCDDDDDAGEEADGGDQPFTPIDSTVFSEGAIGSLRVKNRLVRAATDDLLCEDGRPLPAHYDAMNEVAMGGAGLVISGMAGIWESEILPNVMYAYDDEHIEFLTDLREGMGKADGTCKVVAQIGHSGNRYWPFDDYRVGPSDIPWPKDFKPEMRALQVAEIEDIVTAFAQGARRFKEAGWDGVELHGAHGYLISSFLSPYTNQRDDEYGGSLEKRVRIVRDIVSETRGLVGPDFPIMIKVNSEESPMPYFTSDLQTEMVEFEGGINQEIFLETANELNKLELDAIEVSANTASVILEDVTVQPYFEEAAAALEVDMPVIVTGGNRGVETIERIIGTGEIALFGMARPFIWEPDLPNKWLRGETRHCKCISCNLCIERLPVEGLKCHQKPEDV